MSSSFLRGAGYVLAGLRWLPRAGVRGLVALPLAISTVLFGGAIWLGASQLQRFSSVLQDALPSWLAWLHWLLWPLFVLVALVAFFFAFTLLANLIAAPFNGLLAERVTQLAQAATEPRPAPPPATSSWRDLLLSPLTELRKLLYYALWFIPLLVLAFFPVTTVVAPVLWAASGAWMLAQEYASYPLDQRGLSFREQRQLLRRYWPLTLGFGGMTLVLTLIPGCNFLVMPAAVIGATLMWNQELNATA